MGNDESKCCVLPGDCIKAIIAAILVTKLHRSLKHIITPALKRSKYTNADKKEKKHVRCVSFYYFGKKGRLIWVLQKNIKHASLQPNKIAIKENDRVLTYKEWFESVYKVANWLNEKESKNKTIVIVLENRIEF